MTISVWLKQAQHDLTAVGISTARLDALVLLEDALNTNRAQLLAHPEQKLSSQQQKLLNTQIERRKAHEPLAYIRGKTEFYDREFIITPDVLEPRPESETMIDLLKGLPAYESHTIVDVGTGSGALAITAKLEIPETEVIAIDIDPKCLKVARKNAQKLGADIKFMQGDLLQPLPSIKFIILANLPYVPDNFQINPAAMKEPQIAIFGGPDGLNLYRRMFNQIKNLSPKPRYVFTESLPPQHLTLHHIARNAGYAVETVNDFICLYNPL